MRPHIGNVEIDRILVGARRALPWRAKPHRNRKSIGWDGSCDVSDVDMGCLAISNVYTLRCSIVLVASLNNFGGGDRIGPNGHGLAVGSVEVGYGESTGISTTS